MHTRAPAEQLSMKQIVPGSLAWSSLHVTCHARHKPAPLQRETLSNSWTGQPTPPSPLPPPPPPPVPIALCVAALRAGRNSPPAGPRAHTTATGPSWRGRCVAAHRGGGKPRQGLGTHGHSIPGGPKLGQPIRAAPNWSLEKSKLARKTRHNQPNHRKK